MEQLTAVTKITGAVLILALIAGCQTVSSNQAELAASKKEFLLAQSGFKVITVTTAKQQQAINGLAQYSYLRREVPGENVLCVSHKDKG